MLNCRFASSLGSYAFVHLCMPHRGALAEAGGVGRLVAARVSGTHGARAIGTGGGGCAGGRGARCVAGFAPVTCSCLCYVHMRVCTCVLACLDVFVCLRVCVQRVFLNTSAARELGPHECPICYSEVCAESWLSVLIFYANNVAQVEVDFLQSLGSCGHEFCRDCLVYYFNGEPVILFLLAFTGTWVCSRYVVACVSQPCYEVLCLK